MAPEHKLQLVKLAHTVIWAVFAGCIVAIPVFAFQGRLGVAATLIAVVLGEVLVLVRTCLRSPRGRAAVFAGGDARRGAQWIARLSTSAATPQTARKGHCPSGWSEIGRLDAPSACMGTSPCGASEASTHPDCAPTLPLRDRKHVLNGMRCPLTDVASRYTAQRQANFDIYLPLWLARHNQRIFGTLYAVGTVCTGAAWWAGR